MWVEGRHWAAGGSIVIGNSGGAPGGGSLWRLRLPSKAKERERVM